MNLEQTVRSQRIRIEELEEELRQTKQSLHVTPVLFPSEWGLTPAQARLLGAFTKSPFLTHEKCFLAVALNHQTEADNLVKVQIVNLRKKIEPLGLKIINRWGEGYEMPEDSVAFLREALTRRTAA
jgi:DNA-binding response OmpR family regulator